MQRLTHPLETDRLWLRPFQESDLDAVHAIERQAEVARYLYEPPSATREESRERLRLKMQRSGIDDEHSALLLAVERKAAGGVIGHVVLMRRSVEHRQGEIGYVLDPAHHGHGYATEAAAVMVRLGFEELGLHRIVGRLDARNAASAAVLERLGMRREAHLRENELVKGEWVDELVYAILADEWRAAHDGTPG